MLVYLFFIIGFVLLIYGADRLIEGGAALAKKMGISEMVIGLTVVAFGTSMPEFAVNVLGSIKGNTGVVLGNVIGSNVANILLILGVSSIIYPLSVQKNTINKEIPFSMLAAIVLAFLLNDALIDGKDDSALTRIDGLVLLSFFSVFLYYVFSLATEDTGEEEVAHPLPVWKAILFVLFGIFGLAVGGQWIVDGAVKIANIFGISERIIGVTIVALGTSLPELATSAVAAYKKSADIAIGNVVGSNIFNIFWVLGVSTVISEIPSEEQVNLDIGMVLLASMLLFSLILLNKHKKIEKWHGGVFLIVYASYIFSVFVN